MRFAIFVLAVLAAVVNAIPQTSATAKSPSNPPPSGCSPNYPSTFEVEATSLPMKIKKRQGTLILTLNNSILLDSVGRTGYIASNNQLQFDNPPQENAIYTAGFSLCSNGSLALGGTALWWKCQSGNFYNLYNSNIAAQCTAALIDLHNATVVATTTTTAQATSETSAGQRNTTESQTKPTTGTSSSATTAAVSSSKSTGVAMSLRAGDAMAALAGFAAAALL